MMLGNSVWESTLQARVPEESLGRVSAYDWFGSLALNPVGMAIWGPIAVAIGLHPALWVAVVALAVINVTLLSRPAIRQPARAVSSDAACEHVFVPYVELHAHTAFSFLDGASSPPSWRRPRSEQGHSAMAVVDHNGVSGSMEFAMAAKPLGLRAIHGVEMDLVDGRHVTLLVENGVGWRNLCRIVTRAHRDDRAEARAAAGGAAGDAGGVLVGPGAA